MSNLILLQTGDLRHALATHCLQATVGEGTVHSSRQVQRITPNGFGPCGLPNGGRKFPNGLGLLPLTDPNRPGLPPVSAGLMIKGLPNPDQTGQTGRAVGGSVGELPEAVGKKARFL